MKDKILVEIEKMKHKLSEMSDYMYQNPELGDQEYMASKLLAAFLREYNFQVETGIAGRPTAFRGIYDTGREGPTVAFLCEYDALPEVGHGCGHNMIGVMSAGAAAALSITAKDQGLCGKIIAMGTPAEETNGAKVVMAEQGIFDGIDVAMMVHPNDKTEESGTSLAMQAIQFNFKGKTSHAASEPESGINALDAVIMTFNGISTLRQHVKSDVRIHGIISKGGVAANIVPDDCEAKFYVRAREGEYLTEVVEKVKRVAQGAALMTGATLEITNYELSYENLVTNRALSRTFSENLRALGETKIDPPSPGHGSLDMGNVSKVVPAIHPYICMGRKNIIGHSKEMADYTISEEAHNVIVKGAAALACTGYDVLTDNALLKEIRNEFEDVLNLLKK